MAVRDNMSDKYEDTRTVSGVDVKPDEVPMDEESKLFLTQPFHGDFSDSDDDDCPVAEDAFLKRQYIPKTLLIDRDIGDPPLEMVLEAHRKRVLQSRTGKKSSGSLAGVVPEKATKERINERPNKRRTIQRGCVQQKKSARVTGVGSLAKENRTPNQQGAHGYRFVVDLESGLEDDSSYDNEMERISREVRATYRHIQGILNRRPW